MPFKAGQMRLPVCLVALLGCLQAAASMPVDLCRQYHYENPELSRCHGGKCPPLLQTPPKLFSGLKLLAACNYHINQDARSGPAASGAFFFRGEQVVSGVLRREPSEFINEFTLLGETVTPWPENPPVFFRGRIYLQFPDVLKAEKVFRTPRPDRETPCWEAKVKLKITEMHSIFGSDNTEGDYPQKYIVLELGPYRKCPDPTPDY